MKDQGKEANSKTTTHFCTVYSVHTAEWKQNWQIKKSVLQVLRALQVQQKGCTFWPGPIERLTKPSSDACGKPPYRLIAYSFQVQQRRTWANNKLILIRYFLLCKSQAHSLNFANPNSSLWSSSTFERGKHDDLTIKPNSVASNKTSRNGLFEQTSNHQANQFQFSRCKLTKLALPRRFAIR